MDKKELIFNIHKNDIIEDTIRYKCDLSKKYGLDEHDTHDMFVKIVNYQIETYGSQIQRYIDDDDWQNHQFINKKDRARKNSRKAYYKD